MEQKTEREFSAWREKLMLDEDTPEEKAENEALWKRIEARLIPMNKELRNKRRKKKAIHILRYATAAIFIFFFVMPLFHTPPGNPKLIGKKVLPVIKDKTESKTVIIPAETNVKPDFIKVAPRKVLPKQDVIPALHTNNNQLLAVDNPKMIDPEPPNLVQYTPEPDLLQPIARNELPTIHTNEVKAHPVSTVSTMIYVRKIIKQQTNQTAKANSESFEHTLNF